MTALTNNNYIKPELKIMKHCRKWIFVFPIKKKRGFVNKRYYPILCAKATFYAQKKFIYNKNFILYLSIFKPIVYLVYFTFICYIILKKGDDHTVSSSQFSLNVDFNADE